MFLPIYYFLQSQEEMLCSPCFKVLELLDFLEHKLQRTTASLVSQYWQTAKLRKHCGSKNTGNSTSKSWSMCRAKRRKELCISNEVYPHQTSVTTSPVSQVNNEEISLFYILQITKCCE